MAKSALFILLCVILPLFLPAPGRSGTALYEDWDYFLVIDQKWAVAHLYKKGSDIPLYSCLIVVSKKPLRHPFHGRIREVVFNPSWHPTEATRADYAAKGALLPKYIPPGHKNNAMGAVKFLIDFVEPWVDRTIRCHGTNRPELVKAGRNRKISRDCARFLNESIVIIGREIRGKRTNIVFQNGGQVPS